MSSKPTLKDNMTKHLVTVNWKEPIKKANTIMEDRRIRHLPVVDDEGIVVGILSDRDVRRAMDPRRPRFAPDAVVGDFMSWPAVMVNEDTPIEQVAEGMVDEKLSAFLVNRGNQVVGIVTTDDLLSVLAKLLRRGRGKEKLALSELKYSPVLREAMIEAQAVGL